MTSEQQAMGGQLPKPPGKKRGPKVGSKHDPHKGARASADLLRFVRPDPRYTNNPLCGAEFTRFKCSMMSYARLTGVSYESVQNWIKSGKIRTWPAEHPDAGHIDVLSSVRDYIDVLKARIKDNVIPAPTDAEQDAEADFRRQKARMARLQADKLEGTLVPARDVERERTNEIQRAKARLTAMAAAVVQAVGPYLTPLEGGQDLIDAVRDAVESKVEEALIELSRGDEDAPLEDFGDEDDAVGE